MATSRGFAVDRGLSGGQLALLLVGLLVGSLGCNAFDEPAPEGTQTFRVIPEDTRPAVEASQTLLPVSGGTLLSLGAGGAVIASDPDRDRVSIAWPGAEGEADRVVGIDFDPGSEPGRAAHLGEDRFALVLRGTGEVVALAAETRAELWRTEACRAPRGVAYTLSSDEVHVACAEGSLVTLAAADGAVLSRLALDSDLRDVVSADGRLYVSRFRAAEVLFIEDGELARRVRLPGADVIDPFSGTQRQMKATVAWRMLSAPRGGVAIVHQRSTDEPVATEPEEDSAEQSGFEGASASPYGGGGGGCSGIVQSAVTTIDAQGGLRTSPSLRGITLPVDVAITSGGDFVIANAGPVDPDAPVPHVTVFSTGGNHGSSGATFTPSIGVSIFSGAELVTTAEDQHAEVTCAFGFDLDPEPTTAVALRGSDLVMQRPRDASLLAVRDPQSFSNPLRHISLGGPTLRDTGHDLFHRDSGAGIACASCHPEGTDDGHVWQFEGLGPRRTQSLAVPLRDTAPFHWDGELESVTALMDEVFVQRMGGVFQTEERLSALERWLFTAPQPLSLRGLDEAAERGKVLFDSAEVGCKTCHAGESFTDNRSYEVGTGQLLQVPSLIGLSAHAPFMHDGCAKTLEQRFDPECGGGDAHGNTSRLSQTELADLVAYLETL